MEMLQELREARSEHFAAEQRLSNVKRESIKLKEIEKVSLILMNAETLFLLQAQRTHANTGKQMKDMQHKQSEAATTYQDLCLHRHVRVKTIAEVRKWKLTQRIDYSATESS